MSTQPASKAAAASGVVCCLVGGEQYALRASDVSAVARAEQMAASVGASADGRIGILRHGERLVPVFSLAAILGLDDQAHSAGQHIVVTSSHRGPFGILVDRAVRTGRSEEANVYPLPGFVGQRAGRWFAGLLHAGELSCLLMHPDGIHPGPGRGPGPGPGSRTCGSAEPGSLGPNTIAVLFSSAALPRCEAQRYALGAQQISAVVQTLPTVALPGAPPFVESIASWRGEAVPVVDFRDTCARRTMSRYLIARTSDGGSTAIGLDGDIKLHHTTGEDRLVSRASAPFVRGVFHAAGEQVAVLDVEALVACGEELLAPVGAT